MKANGLVRLTRDPELRYTNNGTAVLKLGVAYDMGFGDKKVSCFIDAVIWGKQGEALSKHLSKGTQISIESADLEFQQWEHEGQKRSKHVLNIREIKFAGGDKSKQATQQSRQPEPFVDDVPF